LERRRGRRSDHRQVLPGAVAVLDLESPDLEMRPRGRRRGAGTPPETSCYALSAVDGSIATSALGPRATFPCGDEETFYAISDADGSIASASLGERATFTH
jgi:hypothetical protein